MSGNPSSVAVIGAGIIGLSCAWELARRGRRVTLFDKGQPGLGASYAAAGMLGPAYEAAADPVAHPGMYDLCLQSSKAWPAFAEALQRASGYTIGYQRGETIAVNVPGENAEQLDALGDALSARGLAFEELDGEALRTRERSLSPDIARALLIPGDGQVDNRAAITALLAACHKAGVTIVNHTPAEAIDTSVYDHALWTLGVSAHTHAANISPVKGAAFSVRPGSYLPSRIIRFGSHYIVPKSDRVIIGATIEPGVRTYRPDDMLIGKLRQTAAKVCPGVEAAAVLGTWSGLRPATPDHAPMLGQLADGSFIAAGHYRNGILLAPITAQIMADMITGASVSSLASAFSPYRFTRAAP